MNKQQKIAWAIENHPDHELIFMFSNEGTEDHAYTLGGASQILIDEYACIDERVYLMNQDFDELKEEIEENQWLSHFEGNDTLSKEQELSLAELVKEELNTIQWKKAIVVYVDPK